MNTRRLFYFFVVLALLLGVLPVKATAQGGDSPVFASHPTASRGAAIMAEINADVSLVLDDGTLENSIGLTAGGEFIWLNRFTPSAGDFPFTLDQVHIMFDQYAGAVGDAVQVAVYADTDGDGDPSNATLLAAFDETVQAVDAVTWSVYTLDPPVEIAGPGDVLIGAINRGNDAAGLYPAALDQTSSAGRSWIGYWTTTDAPNPPTLPPDGEFVVVDTYFPGNWLVRGYGTFGEAEEPLCEWRPVLLENFDVDVTPPSLPADWNQVDVNGTPGSWATREGTRYPSGYSAHSAPNLVYFNSYTASSGSSTRLYKMTGLDLGLTLEANLSLWMFHDTGYSNDDRVQVQVSTDGGTTWSDVGNPIYRYNGSSYTWTEHIVDLSAFAGQPNVMIGLLGISAYGNDVHVDDVGINGCYPPPFTVRPAVQSGVGCLNSGATHNVVVKNQSGVADTFHVSISDNNWDTVVSPVDFALDTDTQQTVTVDVTIPGYVFAGDSDVTTLFVYRDGDPAAIKTAQVTTFAGNVWVPAGSGGAATLWPGFAADGASLYYFDGQTKAGAASSRTQIYTPGAGWTTGTESSLGSSMGGVAGYDGTTGLVYYATGFTDGMVGTVGFSAYDPATDTWTPLANRPAALGLGAGGVSDGGKFVWAGGSPNSGFIGDTPVYVYDIATDTWTAGTTLSGVGFTAAGYAMAGDTLYVGGSYLGTHSFYAYDVATDAWAQLADLPAGAGVVSPLFIYDGTDLYLVGGGASPSMALAATYRYDIAADTWAPFSDLNKATLGAGGGYLDGHLYTFGGGVNATKAQSPVPHEHTLPLCLDVDTAQLEGHVVDGLTDTPIAGAKVHAVGTGPAVTAATTPVVYTDDSGYYSMTLYAPAEYDITASFGDFDPVTAHIALPTVGGVVTQDFTLGPPVANPSPRSFAKTLYWGEVDTADLTIANDGYSVLDWELIETNGGFIPAGTIEVLPIDNRHTSDEKGVDLARLLYNGPGQPVQATRPAHYIYHGPNSDAAILVYADDDQHSPTAVELGLQALGLTYTFYGYTVDGTGLDAWLTDLQYGGPWDFVIMAEDSWARVAADDYAAMNDFILGGGKAVCTSWAIGYDTLHSDHALWATMGASYASWLTSPANMYWWEPGHPLFNRPEDVPEFTDLDNLGYIGYGAKMDALDGVTEALAGFDTAPASGQGGLILRNDNLTLYKGMTDNLNGADLDADAKMDAAELWTNIAQYLLGGGGGGDIPWLAEAPITGTVPVLDVQPVVLTFDAGAVMDYGTYTGTLALASDDPANPEIVMPVQLTVLYNPKAGLIEGTVTTDRPGGPLEGATVDLANEATGWSVTLTTDAAGYYSQRIPEADLGELTVKISAANYLTDEQTVTVTTPDPTVHDVELERVGPWIELVPEKVEQDLQWGTTDLADLTIGNTGNETLTWDINLAGFEESFEDAFPPLGWQVIDNGGCGPWESTQTTGRPNYTGGTGYAADADSDWCGMGMDTELWTPFFDLSSVPAAQISFLTDFNDFLNQDDGYVDISVDGGSTWTNLIHYARVDVRGPLLETIDLTPFVGNANVVIRFHYVAPGWDWWWEIDDVKLTTAAPSWLSWTPDSGTTGIGATSPATFTLDASNPFVIPGPGDYQAGLVVLNDDPLQPAKPFSVLMHVTANPAAGHVFGTIYGDRTLAGPNQPMPGAYVEFSQLDGSGFYSGLTDENGEFEFYIVPEHVGNYQFYAAADGYQPYATLVALGAGGNVQADGTLRLWAPYLQANPESISEELPWGGSTTVPMVVTNPASALAPLTADIVEMASSYSPVTVQTVELNVPAFAQNELLAGGAVLDSPAGTAAPARTLTIRPDNLALGKIQVGIYSFDSEAGVGWVDTLAAILAAYPDVEVTILPLGTPDVATFQPYDAIVVGSRYSSGAWDPVAVGDALASYVDLGGRVIMIQNSFYAGESSGTRWMVGGRFETEYAPVTYAGYVRYTGTENLGVYNAAHPIMAGWDPAENSVIDYFRSYSDLTLANGGQPVAFWNTGNYYVVANRYVALFNQVLTYDFYWEGDVPMLLHNALLYLVAQDVPWLSETVTHFDLPVGASANTEIGLDASVVTQPGVYHAWLWFFNNDPMQQGAYVPVDMIVEAEPSMGQVRGTVTLNRHATGPHMPAANATVVLSSGKGVVELRTNAAGQYAYYYVQGDVTPPLDIQITASYPNYQDDTITVNLASGETEIANLEVELLAPWLTYSPPALEAVVQSGGQETLVLGIENPGLETLNIPMIMEIPATATLPVETTASNPMSPAANGVDPLLLEQFAASPDGQVSFFVAFKDMANLGRAASLNRSAQGRFVVDALQSAADRAQAGVKAYLDKQGLEYRSYWINNTLYLKADQATMDVLAGFPEVAGVRAERTYKTMPVGSASPALAAPNSPAYPWNVQFPQADLVHTTLGIRGQGMVVANIDSGVEYEHIGLVGNYRGNLGGGSFDHTYSWHNPGDDECGGGAPCDTDSHGTGTMGIMALDDDPALPDNAWIGMAPDAQWIACLGLPYGSGSDAELVDCFEWMIAPGGDPDMRPDVVNSSWGNWSPNWCDTSGTYVPVFEALYAAGIFNAFAAGNVGDYVSPPHCASSTAPANTVDEEGVPLTFASGAHGADGSLDYYSSGGPNACNPERLFPDLTAPGLGSCTSGLNDTYSCSFGGTSAASPHTAGCAALVMQAAPYLSVREVEQVLRDAAVDVDDTSCGGDADWNNSFGEGYLNCYNAVLAVGGGYDIPWLALDPITGTVPAGGSLPIDVTFDAIGLPGGVYTGTLRILHNDPLAGEVLIPVQLTVTSQPDLFYIYLPVVMRNQ